jgi:hypothetical protein
MKPSWNPQDRKVFKIISTPLFHKIFFKKVTSHSKFKYSRLHQQE